MASLQGALLGRARPLVLAESRRHLRGPFGRPPRTFEDRNRMTLDRFKWRRLELSEPLLNHPYQFKRPQPPPDPRVERKERKLLPLTEESPPYHKYGEREVKDIESLGEYYDPLFNPHIHEGRYTVDPTEEPFNAIYKETNSDEYTKVRDITSPELWAYVERLKRIQLAPTPPTRKPNEPVTQMPSGFVPPPECPPDLPYHVMRTRNYLLPVYYKLHDEPEKCYTVVRKLTGDLWKFEQDLRSHLESLSNSRHKILSSVYETDGCVSFRGKHLHQVVDWLHQQGF